MARGAMDYKSSRWQRLREAALARDGWLCQECRRYGKRTEASVVHHVWPAEEFPAWQWKAWNLVSLCQSCHNEMHVRRTCELTERGEAWRRRRRPPDAGA